MEQKKTFRGVILETRHSRSGWWLSGPWQQETPGKDSEASRSLEKSVENLQRGRDLGDGFPRTGYSGRTLCFEIFVPTEKLEFLWQAILSSGEKEGIVTARSGCKG